MDYPMPEFSSDMKVFAIDYFIPAAPEKREIRTHLTYATSRKNAENNTRTMEAPDRVNIIKITPIVFDEIADRILNDAIVAHLNNGETSDERDADVPADFEVC